VASGPDADAEGKTARAAAIKVNLAFFNWLTSMARETATAHNLAKAMFLTYDF
jgi:hypothetical protein